MMFGLTQQEYRFLWDQLVFPLQEAGCQVWCFGSRAVGTHQKFSDVDILVQCPCDMELGAFREKLEESHFPFKVDLVKDKDLAETYRKNVEPQKKVFIPPEQL